MTAMISIRMAGLARVFGVLGIAAFAELQTSSCVTKRADVGEEPPHWRVVESGTSANLRSVWAATEDDAWAVGDEGAVLHWDGAAWTTRSVLDEANFHAVWGTASNDVWAVGGIASTRVAVSMHFDGSTWAQVAVPASGHMFDAWTARSGDAWALCSVQPADSFAVAGGALWHFDGVRWSLAEGAQSATRIRGARADDAWVLHTDNSLAHWDGITWTPAATPRDPTEISYLAADPFNRALWAADNGDLWIAGGWWFHWVDGTWVNPTGGFSVDLAAEAGGASASICGASNDDVWFVGSFGRIGHWDGSHLAAAVAPSTDAWLHSVHGTGPLDVWAVGDTGTILHYGR